MSRLRALLYVVARVLGDVSAVRNNKVSRRIKNRIVGRATGRLIGRLLR